MRSITRSYFGGSSNRTPPSWMYSATTSPRPCSLMPLIIASGNVFSRPTSTPTRFISVEYPFAKIKQNTRHDVACQTGIRPCYGQHPCSCHWGLKGLFTGPMLQFDLNVWLSPVGAVKNGDLKFKENGYICFVDFL